MKKSYVIEIEEAKAETVVNLLAQINVNVNQPKGEQKFFVKLTYYAEEPMFLKLNRSQRDILEFLINECECDLSYEIVDPNEIFQEI